MESRRNEMVFGPLAFFIGVVLFLLQFPSEAWGDRFDFEYNTSGVLDQKHDSWMGGDYIVATIENKSGQWLRLRELSLPLGVDTRLDSEWIVFLNVPSGDPPGNPEFADYSGTFDPDTPPPAYTDIDLYPHGILVEPGTAFSVGIRSAYIPYDLYVGTVKATFSAYTFRWIPRGWESLEGVHAVTALIQVYADYVDMSDILVFPDGSGLFPTIQHAIAAVDFGGTVRLADGVFKGEGNSKLTFFGKDLTLKSVSEDPKTCIIDCEGDLPLSGPSTGTGIIFNEGEGPGAVVSGITIRNGVFEVGAGILVDNSSPVIHNCVFENGFSAAGAGVYVYKGSPEIVACVFRDNYAEWSGGGLQMELSDGVVSHCRFERNHAGNYGGGALFGDCDGTSLEHSVFYANWSDIYGGALLLGGTAISMSQCTLSENSAPKGSAIYLEGQGPDIWMSILSFGDSPPLFIDGPRSVPDFVCCDIFGNTGGDWVGEIADQLGTDGNFNLDPQYCGELGTGDLTLQDDSPCGPGGNDCGLLIGGETVECDDTVAAPTTWSRLKQLY